MAQQPSGFDPTKPYQAVHPSGFDPTKPYQVERPSEPPAPAPAPFNPPRVGSMPLRVGSMREDSVRFSPHQVGVAMDALPMVGAGLAVAATDGLALPVLGPYLTGAVAAGAGGAAGQVVKDTQWSMPATQRATNAAKSFAGQAIGQAAAVKVPEWMGDAATGIYRGYLKPSLAGVSLAKARKIVKTALDEGLTINQAGEEYGKKLIKELNDRVKVELLSAAHKGVVNLETVANRVRQWANKKYFRPGAPSEDLDAAMKVADSIDLHPSIAAKGQNPTAMTPMEGYETKQALDKAIGETGFGAERSAATEARKVGRFMARKEVESVVPSAAPLTKRESKLIDAVDAVTRAAGREENKNQFTGVLPILSVLGGSSAAGAAASGDAITGLITGLITTIATRVALSPGIQSRAAILAYKFSKVPGTSLAQALRMGLIIAQRELSVTSPVTGNVYTYNTKDKADDAKKAAGIR